ncbi:PREDICTED: probable tRNA pseudouridine synthase 2 [Crocodylus porosus]|uniref:TruB pseudouridine synthase family member 2 n=1 Tax=Crocodylus porosus TaxID=8502 RepID=A0A7M4DVL7_CROPO|nr:PREDICTED: probable tRNA pseudouridine synthase 2 [Crocodylus porosus]
MAVHGLFAVYKPGGVGWPRVRDAVETRLLAGLNSLKQRPPRQHVRFLPGVVEGEAGKELTLVPTYLPVLADHLLVKGPRFTRLKVGAGHRLDVKSSGVFVLGVGQGCRMLTDMYNAHFTKDYTVRGLFGKATDDFSDTGKLIEKTTFDHINREMLEKILAVIQGSNHKALGRYANIDLKTQEAYELAVKGLLRPMQKSPPLITAIRCLEFAPPEFQLEIRCLHETQQYLRKIVHEIGLELKSAAVCTQVRRTRDGFFTLDKALLRTHWDLENIQKAIQDSRLTVKTELEKSLGYLERTAYDELIEMDQVEESDASR